MEAITVSQLTGRIRSVLEFDFGDVLVEGEISSFKQAASGHRYFVLKDEGAALNCTLWRTRRLFFTPQDGMKVRARGAVTVYEPRGQYQLDVVELSPRGEGELRLAFERLKTRLAEEGLFDVAHKKPLPEFPETIGVVTSRSGAALHDFIVTARGRNPAVKIVVRPSLVQGEGAAADIAAAVGEFNEYGAVDAVVVTRGGGSIEDLWAFNEERVARAIYDSAIPVVSAVGHEIDFTIADLVADARAATPTAAAELLVRSREELIARISGVYYFLATHLRRRAEVSKASVRHVLASAAMSAPAHLVGRHGQSLDAAERTMGTAVAHAVAIARRDVESLERRLAALHPRRALRRGYAIVRKGGAAVSRAAALAPGDEIGIEFADGTRQAEITT